MSFRFDKGARGSIVGALLTPVACLALLVCVEGSRKPLVARPASHPPAERPAKAGVLVIAYMGESRVALVDSATYRTLATLETGKDPHEVRVSPDKRHAYIAAGKSITAIDLKSRSVKATFDLGTYSSHDIRISRDGRRLWAACAGARTIL